MSVIKLYIEAHAEDKVCVALNTDSKELQSLIHNQNIVHEIVIVPRKEEHAGDIVAKILVIQDTYNACKKKRNFDVIVDLDITSPMRRLQDIENAIATLLEDKECDLVFSAVAARRSPYFNMVEKKGNYYGKICSSMYTARQQAPKSYELNASIYAYSPHFLSEKIEKTILEYNCRIIEMPDYLILDIDSEKDFKMMEILSQKFVEEDYDLEKVMLIGGMKTGDEDEKYQS